jgi:hypothetical protein
LAEKLLGQDYQTFLRNTNLRKIPKNPKSSENHVLSGFQGFSGVFRGFRGFSDTRQPKPGFGRNLKQLMPGPLSELLSGQLMLPSCSRLALNSLNL